MFNDLYKNKKVLITGDTGFKGSWLSLWLLQLGADVIGCSLHPPSQPNHHELLGAQYNSIKCDIRNLPKLKSIFKKIKPEIVFHLAAQALVRESYQNPIYTIETNVMGTANIFEACRSIESVKAILIITSDKCYENKEWVYGYRETDPMGGHDPYSASKGCAEIICSSYRNSFFPTHSFSKKHETLIASCRSGNVVGGGDWGAERLVPDIMKSASRRGQTIIRNPHATRPWQHVLEPLSGYLALGEKLVAKQITFSGAWNFGPLDEDQMKVLDVVNSLKQNWTAINYKTKRTSDALHEAGLLKLDCSKAQKLLTWKPTWDKSETFEKTAEWYKQYYEFNKIITRYQLDEYIEAAYCRNLPWTGQ